MFAWILLSDHEDDEYYMRGRFHRGGMSHEDEPQDSCHMRENRAKMPEHMRENRAKMPEYMRENRAKFDKNDENWYNAGMQL